MQTGVLSARRLVQDAVEELESAGIPEAKASAEVLLAELLGVRRSELALLKEPVTGKQAELYEAWISRRKKRETVQRILGYAYFRNLRLELDEHTLIPRTDTESVVDAALEAVDRRGESCRILDLGIAISIAQERPSCDVHATDSSEGASKIARRNAQRSGVAIRFHRADLVSGLDGLLRSVEVLVSNPPYVRRADIPKLAPEVRDWDPHVALDGGPDGLDFYRRIFAESSPLLAERADVVLEVGDDQAEAVLELGRCASYYILGTHRDLTGTRRTVLLRWGSG